MKFVKNLQQEVKPIFTKWIYIIKRDGKDNILKYKSQLIARGFT